MSSREYLYVRRMWINKNVAVLINRCVNHPAVPVSRKSVRVQDYVSHTVMHPHTTSDEDGFEYEVTYFDNPQTNLPSSCVNWVATAAMPEFLTYFDNPQTNLPSSCVNWVATAAMPEFLTKVHTVACQRKRKHSGLSAMQIM
jgi:hypothetical protein